MAKSKEQNKEFREFTNMLYDLNPIWYEYIKNDLITKAKAEEDKEILKYVYALFGLLDAARDAGCKPF